MTGLRVLGGGAVQGLVEKVWPRFAAATGATIEGTFGAVGAMKARLLAGEPADVVILSRALIDELAGDGRIVAASVRDVASVATAVAVRQGDPLPSIGDKSELRAALLAADAIHFPDPAQATAGIHFTRVLKNLGIRDEVAGRLRTAPNGATAMRALATSHDLRPLGCTQATEIEATAGIVLVGPLPQGCALVTVYAAAVTATTRVPAAAHHLIDMLTVDIPPDRR